MAARHQNVRCEKLVSFDGSSTFTVDFLFHNAGIGSVEIRPAVEFNLGLLSSGLGRHCTSNDRQLADGSLNAPIDDRPLKQLSVHDDHRKTIVDFAWSEPMDLWRYPVETVSQSEAGFERNYQCSCFLWHTLITLDAGETRTLTLRTGFREI
jgi:alpha-amylase